MNKDLDYLMTSDFNEGLTNDELIELLVAFRYEYRLLSGRNSSLAKQIDKLSFELDNLNGLLLENNIKSSLQIAELENNLHFLKNKLNRKLTFNERFKGKISEK